MSFTREKLEEQQAMVRHLREEMARLNAQFAKHHTTLGANVAALDSTQPVPPELAAKLTESQAEAKRAGEARAAQCAASFESGAKSAGSSRRGVIRL